MACLIPSIADPRKSSCTEVLFQTFLPISVIPPQIPRLTETPVCSLFVHPLSPPPSMCVFVYICVCMCVCVHAYIHVYMYVFNRNDFLSEMGLFVELSIIL